MPFTGSLGDGPPQPTGNVLSAVWIFVTSALLFAHPEPTDEPICIATMTQILRPASGQRKKLKPATDRLGKRSKALSPVSPSFPRRASMTHRIVTLTEFDARFAIMTLTSALPAPASEGGTRMLYCATPLNGFTGPA